MKDRNVIALDQSRRSQRLFPEEKIVGLFIFLIFDAMILAGMTGAFVLTRVATDAIWPPAGQPWFPPAGVAISTVLLLASGVPVFLAARAWEKQEARIRPLLLGAIVLAGSFLLLQVVLWISLVGQGASLRASPHGDLFCLIVATHAIHAVAAVVGMATVWVRIGPLRDGDRGPWGSLDSSSFQAARILWYFTVGAWPVLYLSLYS